MSKSKQKQSTTHRHDKWRANNGRIIQQMMMTRRTGKRGAGSTQSIEFLEGKGRLVTQRAFKGRHTWWGDGLGVVSVLYPGKLLAPGAGVMWCQAAESAFMILVGSHCPLVWGWKSEDRIAEDPICLQNQEVNCGPLSDTTSTAKLWRRKTWYTSSWAVSLN